MPYTLLSYPGGLECLRRRLAGQLGRRVIFRNPTAKTILLLLYYHMNIFPLTFNISRDNSLMPFVSEDVPQLLKLNVRYSVFETLS